MNALKKELNKKFREHFFSLPNKYFSCGGRFEILGNHTDHNHGLCLAATCDLCISSAVKKRDDNIVRLVSEGMCDFEIRLSNLNVDPNEKASTQGLIRGVAKYLSDKGYQVGGFTIYMQSTIFPGAGVSSSAAFELLIAGIFNDLYNKGKIPTLVLCKAGQFAENNYFGKASGLLDQIGVGYGNIVSIDFENIESPVVEQVKFPFENLHFVTVNTGGSHAALSDLYSAIPQDMYRAAKVTGHNFLRESSMKEVDFNKESLRTIEYTRAKHFFTENERVALAKEALKRADEKTFLEQVNASRASSTNLLKNMMVGNYYAGSPLEACDLAMEVMENHGACKINGGGFAGSIICIVPSEYLESFIAKMAEKYGEANVKELHVRTEGPSQNI